MCCLKNEGRLVVIIHSDLNSIFDFVAHSYFLHDCFCFGQNL